MKAMAVFNAVVRRCILEKPAHMNLLHVEVWSISVFLNWCRLGDVHLMLYIQATCVTALLKLTKEMLFVCFSFWEAEKIK